MRSAIMCVAVSMMLSACGSDSAIGLYDEGTLISHQERWHSEGLHSYSFDLDQQSLAKRGNVHIVVQSDVVVSVIYRDTGLPPDDETGWPTIDGLFDVAKQVIDARYVTTFDIEYDSPYGYITVLSAHANDPGGGYTAHVSNFVPEPR